MCRKRIEALFQRFRPPKKKPAVTEKDLTVKPKFPRKWWEFPFRIIRTGRGGHNMPRFQRCPGCGARAKRLEKTGIGAIYQCRCKTTFQILHSKLAQTQAASIGHADD